MPASPSKTPAAKRVPPAKAAKPAPLPEVEAEDAAGPATVRLKELVDRVVASTGAKKKGTKEVVEATLTELGLALGRGETLNLPDFGKLRVARPQGAQPGSAMTLKLRPAAKPPKKNSAEGGLAEAADQG